MNSNRYNGSFPLAKIFLIIVTLFIIIGLFGLLGLVLIPTVIFVGIILLITGIVIPIVALFPKQRVSNVVRGSGEIMTGIREVKYFEKVSISLPCELVFEPGKEQEVTIEADCNILGYILTYVQDNKLFIVTKNSLKPSKTIRVTITSNVIKDLALTANNQATLNKINEELLSIHISGRGLVTGNGKVDSLKVKITGNGSLLFKGVQTSTTDIVITGKGNSELYVKDRLEAQINGNGKLTVWGKPEEINERIKGSGKINIV